MTSSTGPNRRARRGRPGAVPGGGRGVALPGGGRGAVSPKGARGPHSAFTVIELLMVILIVGTMAALSAPKLRGSYERLRLSESANSLCAAMRTARELAVTEGTPHRVLLDITDGAYWIEKADADDLRYEGIDGRWGRKHGFADGVKAASGPEATYFSPDGRAAQYDPLECGGAAVSAIGPLGTGSSAAGPFGAGYAETQVLMTNERGDSRVVIVDNVTGRAWVEKRQTEEDANGTRGPR